MHTNLVLCGSMTHIKTLSTVFIKPIKVKLPKWDLDYKFRPENWEIYD